MKKLLYIIPAIMIVVVIIAIIIKSKQRNTKATAPEIPKATGVGAMAFAKNPNGVNIRRGPGLSTLILLKDATGPLGLVSDRVPGYNDNGIRDGYTWYRLVGAQDGIFIGYVREDVVIFK